MVLLGIPSKRKVRTKRQIEKKRSYNRIKKQQSRARITRAKAESVKVYDRHRKRAKVKRKAASIYESKDGVLVKFYSKSCIRKASWRARQRFPKSPRKFYQVLKHIDGVNPQEEVQIEDCLNAAAARIMWNAAAARIMWVAKLFPSSEN